MSFMRLTRRRLGGCLASLAGAAALAATIALPAHAADAAPRVQFVTSEGSFVIELYPDKAPKTVENFLQYVNDKFYDGTVFHRVIKGFMVQGGGFDKDYRQKPTRPSVKHEGRESTIGTGKSVRLYCSGVDLLDGTPIVDIKPYIPFVESKPTALQIGRAHV